MLDVQVKVLVLTSLYTSGLRPKILREEFRGGKTKEHRAGSNPAPCTNLLQRRAGKGGEAERLAW